MLDTSTKKDNIKLRGVIKYVYKKMGKAILDYSMINPGDKVLVAVSGGMDSLSLLKLFIMRKKRVPIDFEFIACMVSTDFIEVDTNAVINFFNENNIPFLIKELKLNNSGINCFWCSWNRRKILFETAKEKGCSKIALGHNLDDITETIMMNLVFFGEVSSMKPKISLFNGQFDIVRPLCYITKRDIHNFAVKLGLPFTNYKCLYGKDTRRELVKNIIKTIEKDCPAAKNNIFNALKNIKKDYLPH
ncbi:MAG: hypothetical protein B1H08_06585 [Candidatus Omnitrophica bacterium 4484_171]|nr:MAG: hypothetical protein B1H08_06585 [Candidatus Omnitrophica bacterium 4484_171]